MLTNVLTALILLGLSAGPALAGIPGRPADRLEKAIENSAFIKALHSASEVSKAAEFCHAALTREMPLNLLQQTRAQIEERLTQKLTAADYRVISYQLTSAANCLQAIRANHEKINHLILNAKDQAEFHAGLTRIFETDLESYLKRPQQRNPDIPTPVEAKKLRQEAKTLQVKVERLTTEIQTRQGQGETSAKLRKLQDLRSAALGRADVKLGQAELSDRLYRYKDYLATPWAVSVHWDNLETYQLEHRIGRAAKASIPGHPKKDDGRRIHYVYGNWQIRSNGYVFLDLRRNTFAGKPLPFTKKPL